MKNRIKLIRKHFALSQEQFANKIHRTSGFISNVENGKSGLSDTTIDLICSEFSVREDWLREGAEPMFLPEKGTEIVDKCHPAVDLRKASSKSQEYKIWGLEPCFRTIYCTYRCIDIAPNNTSSVMRIGSL